MKYVLLKQIYIYVYITKLIFVITFIIVHPAFPIASLQLISSLHYLHYLQHSEGINRKTLQCCLIIELFGLCWCISSAMTGKEIYSCIVVNRFGNGKNRGSEMINLSLKVCCHAQGHFKLGNKTLTHMTYTYPFPHNVISAIRQIFFTITADTKFSSSRHLWLTTVHCLNDWKTINGFSTYHTKNTFNICVMVLSPWILNRLFNICILRPN